MADSVLNAWERLNVGRAWNLCKASLHRGGDITALGLFMSSLVILKDSFTQDGRNRNELWSTECAGHKIKEVVAHQYVNAAAAVLLMSTDSAESAMSTASACEWILNLLLEAYHRPVDAKTEEQLRTVACPLLATMYVCHKERCNIAAAYVLIRDANGTCHDTAEQWVDSEEQTEEHARYFATRRFAVPFNRVQLPDPSPVAYHHSARMTGAALDGPNAVAAWQSSNIINAVGHPAFATIEGNAGVENGQSFSNIRIWHFHPCQTRGPAAKTVVKLLQGSAISSAYEVGTVLDGRLLMTDFVSGLTVRLMGYDIGIPNKKGVQMHWKTAGGMKGRRGATMVTCRNTVIAFGGVTEQQGGGEAVLHNDVHSAAYTGPTKEYTRIQTNGDAPRPRYGHSAWMLGDKMCVFGGVAQETEAEWRLLRAKGEPTRKPRLKTLNDLWRLDTVTWTWERLEFYGLKPCPRSHAGIACKGMDIFVVGGKAFPEGDAKQLVLADIFQFYPEENCWVQVLPERESKAWMSARHSPACAVVGSGNVAVLGGFDADDKPVGMDACLTFNISRSDAPGSILALLNVGDSAGDCVPMLGWEYLHHRFGQPDIPGTLRYLLEGRAGSATFLTFNHRLLSMGIVLKGDILANYHVPDVPALFGDGLELSNEREDVFGVEDGGQHWKWGSCPFHTVPLWMGWPSAVLVNQATVGANPMLQKLTQVVKAFATRKAAAEYFRMTQPDTRNLQPGWSHLGLEVGMSIVELGLLYGMSELLVMQYEAGPRQKRQLYMISVMGHYYTCWTATLAPARQCNSPMHLTATLLLALVRPNVSMLVSAGVPVECIHCGQPEHISCGGQRRAEMVKVCRGCRLVRYCSEECQAAAWPQHKAVCQRFRKRNKR